MIVVHQVYNNHTTPLHKGWVPQCMEPTPCEGVLYDCCTLGVQQSLPKVIMPRANNYDGLPDRMLVK
jgi:hypothetical protein